MVKKPREMRNLHRQCAILAQPPNPPPAQPLLRPGAKVPPGGSSLTGARLFEPQPVGLVESSPSFKGAYPGGAATARRAALARCRSVDRVVRNEDQARLQRHAAAWMRDFVQRPNGRPVARFGLWDDSSGWRGAGYPPHPRVLRRHSARSGRGYAFEQRPDRPPTPRALPCYGSRSKTSRTTSASRAGTQGLGR
jgi:hypothetical protein